MTLSDHQFEFLLDVSMLIQFAARRGYKITGGELWRSPETQRIYKDTGRSRTLEGYHQRRLAIDLNLFVGGQYRTDTGAYRELGDFWESLNSRNHWGGNFTTLADGNHFERRV